MDPPLPIREPCPPGACVCQREVLLDNPQQGDARILRLTRAEEKRLVARLENLSSLADLNRVRELMRAQLGMTLTIAPSTPEVRSVRGILIRVEDQPGLCKKTRQAIPAAIRRSLVRCPEIAYAILNQHDLLGD